MQYLHGICEATASPVSSFVRPFSVVLGLSCSVFISSHAPGRAASGNLRKNCGTNPSVLLMSARAAAAAGLGLPVSARATPEAPSTTRARDRVTSLVLVVMVVSLLRVCFFRRTTRRRDLRGNGSFPSRSACRGGADDRQAVDAA